MRRIATLLLIVLSFTARRVAAQEAGQVGITMGYPAAIGVIWHLSESVAVRPEISLTRVTNENVFSIALPTGTTTQVTTNETWQVGAGVSGLFYVSKHDALRTYVSPRFSYSRSTTSSSSPATSGSESTAYLVSGSFGAQYAVGRRFGVFGEVGVSYSRTNSQPTTSPALSSLRLKSTTAGPRSGAGVILYVGS